MAFALYSAHLEGIEIAIFSIPILVYSNYSRLTSTGASSIVLFVSSYLR